MVVSSQGRQSDVQSERALSSMSWKSSGKNYETRQFTKNLEQFPMPPPRLRCPCITLVKGSFHVAIRLVECSTRPTHDTPSQCFGSAFYNELHFPSNVLKSKEHPSSRLPAWYHQSCSFYKQECPFQKQECLSVVNLSDVELFILKFESCGINIRELPLKGKYGLQS